MYEALNSLGDQSPPVLHFVGYPPAFVALRRRQGLPVNSRGPIAEHIVYDCDTGQTTVYHPAPL